MRQRFAGRSQGNADGDAFEIILADGSAQLAALVDGDQGSDLAVLRDSSQVQSGQLVMAIGSAWGAFTNTVAAGVVNAIGRSLTEDPMIPDLHLT
jgi:S1-C subfamily serine protease